MILKMSISNKVRKLFGNPFMMIHYLGIKGLINWFPDKFYLRATFRAKMNKKLNLDNPITYNEKLQWLKLYDRNPKYTNLVDKYEVRKYISETIGEEYLIPIIGVYENVDEIDFNNLPNKFVLKCTHDSGGLVICQDKKKLDVQEAKNRMRKSLKRNYYYTYREWPYKNVKSRILCEKYMVDESGYELKDYKFFCFHGDPKAMFIASDREIDTRFDFFDMNFEHLPIEQGYKNSSKKIYKPKSFDKMVELSKKLSKGIPHVRVDFYEINGEVYFGELTFYHFSGFVEFEPNDFDEIFGNWLNLQRVIG